MPRRSRSQPDPLATFPEWARRLAERYYTKTVSTFILHGAVRDLQPADDGKGGRRFVPLRTFLSDELFGSRDLVVFYDRSSGIRLATPEMQKDFMAAVAGYDTLFGTEYAKAVPKDPARAFPLLESYARVRIADGKSVAVIIDFAETVAPAGDLGYMPGEDRYSLVTLVKWAQDPQFLVADFSVCLIAENLAELNPRLGRNPYAASIELPLPDETKRMPSSATAMPRATAAPAPASSPRSPPSWGTPSTGGRSSGSCSPRAPTCCRWTSSGRGARKSISRSSTRSRTTSASSWSRRWRARRRSTSTAT